MSWQDEPIYEHSDVRFDYIVANNEEVTKEVKDRYLKEASKMLMLTRKDRQYFTNENMKVVESNFIEVRQGYVRHDIEKIVEFMNDHINKDI